MNKRLLMVSDLHCGHKVGLSHPDYGLNKHQAKLFSKWSYMCNVVGHVDAVLVCGDSTEGPNRKGSGSGCWTTDALEQVECAVKLLKMIDSDMYYTVMGSHYHIMSGNVNSDQLVAKFLDGNYQPDQVIRINQRRIHAAHKTSVGQGEDRKTNVAGRMIGTMLMNQASNGLFDIEFRGHTHYYVDVSTATGRYINLPGWKFRDEYIAGLGTNALVADIGWVLLEVTPDNQIIITRDVYQSQFEDNFQEYRL